MNYFYLDVSNTKTKSNLRKKISTFCCIQNLKIRKEKNRKNSLFSLKKKETKETKTLFNKISNRLTNKHLKCLN